MLNHWYKILFIFLISISNLYAQKAFLSWDGNIYKHIDNYEKLHATFSKKICSPGTEATYYDLLRKYRGFAYYLPEINNDIDSGAIKQNLHHFKKKISFLETEEKKLLEQKSIPSQISKLDVLDKTMKELVLDKQAYQMTIVAEQRTEILTRSRNNLKLLNTQYQDLMNTYSFLKSYNYPNDHLKNRKRYDDAKNKKGPKHEREANNAFFYRRIVEDGAYDLDHTRPDLYLRTTLDTLALQLPKEIDFIDEHVRYDLEWSLSRIKTLLDRGYDVHLERLKEWKTRTEESYKFYIEIVKFKNRQKALELIKEKNEASIAMKKFVYSKQAEVYTFWMGQPEMMKALFSLETILFNEVGNIDEPYGLERKDVVHVVLNRMQNEFYRTLDEKQEILEYLTVPGDTYQKEYWLNVLFRIGEFSFTYHYISSVVKIFCPDMSSRGKALREKNLKISLKVLNDYDESFKAMRYFSRVSMLGKIDMTSVWTNYQRIPERAGFEAASQERLIRFYLGNKYEYLYSFDDPKGIKFQVVRIDEETYSLTWIRGRPRFYYYRDPNLFTYFSQK